MVSPLGTATVEIVGHRGASTPQAPENTLAAFFRAVAVLAQAHALLIPTVCTDDVAAAVAARASLHGNETR